MIAMRNIDAKYHRRRLVLAVWIAATVAMACQIIGAIRSGG